MKNPENHYKKRLTRFKRLLRKQELTAGIISNFRLVSALSGLSLAFYLYKSGNHYISTGIFIAALVLFMFLVNRHRRITENIGYTRSLIEINNKCLKRLNGAWKDFSDTGKEYTNSTHPFTGDLDIFGKGSLFQWINNTNTFTGRNKLAYFFTEPLNNKNDIIRRQEAIAELAENISWRQKFEAEAMIVRQKAHNQAALFSWAEIENPFYRKFWLVLTVRILPLITLGLLATDVFISSSLIRLSVPAVILQFLLLRLFGKERSKALKTVYIYEENLKTYYKMLKRFERKKLKSVLLHELQESLTGCKKQKAYRQVEKLAKIVDSISNRNNAVFIIINILTLWDYQCMIALEQWKMNSGRYLREWFSVLGEVEALSSLSLIAYDHPDWAVPEISENGPLLSAKSMGHPLLTKNRVVNDLDLRKPASVLLITGSNMSGKSTLLRTAGINLILAYTGCPVCAEFFCCSLMKVFTCMRVSDNLEDNISSFYAELVRIKMIIDAAKEGKPLFFLLDEIFKGTNSHDRHVGAKTVIKQLGRENALGMVSTHDLELAELEKETDGQIKNYHFIEFYSNGKLSFDYKLRTGVSTTRNALYLIKMAGINIENYEN